MYLLTNPSRRIVVRDKLTTRTVVHDEFRRRTVCGSWINSGEELCVVHAWILEKNSSGKWELLFNSENVIIPSIFRSPEKQDTWNKQLSYVTFVQTFPPFLWGNSTNYKRLKRKFSGKYLDLSRVKYMSNLEYYTGLKNGEIRGS